MRFHRALDRAEPLGEPAFLLGSEDTAVRIAALRTRLDDVGTAPSRFGAGLIVAILAAIEQMECGQSPEADPRVEPHIGSPRARARGQGHVLVIGPVGRRPASQELLARD